MQNSPRSVVTIASIVILGMALGSAAPAFAQNKKGGDKAAAAAATPKTKVYDFSGDTIEGDLIKPEGSSVDARDFAKNSSLIRIRTNFISEIIKSAEDL